MYFKKTIFSLAASVLCAQASAPFTEYDATFIGRDLAAKALGKLNNGSAAVIDDAQAENLIQQIHQLPRPDSVAEDGTLVSPDEAAMNYIMQADALKQQRNRLQLENTVISLSRDKSQELFSLYAAVDHVLSAQALLTIKAKDIGKLYWDYSQPADPVRFYESPLINLIAQSVIFQGTHVVELNLDPQQNGGLRTVEVDLTQPMPAENASIQKVVEENRVKVLEIFPNAFEEPEKVSTEFTDFQIALRKRNHDLGAKINKYKKTLKKSLKNLKNAENMLKGVGSSSSTNITLDPQGLLKLGNHFYQIKPVATNDAETLERTLKHIQGTTLHKTKQVQTKLDVARKEQTILAKAVSIFDEMLQLLSNSRRFS